MKIKVLYFARLRESFGMAEETLVLPAGIETLAGLIAHLAAREDEIWAYELGGERVFRVALDQDLVDLHTPLHEGAEIAIFPPVTGG